MRLDETRSALLKSPADWAVVQAFAGAGKTRLAIEIAAQFRKAAGLKLGQRILFVSFSTASCFRAEESLRISALPADQVEVCTFHSFALGLVRRYAQRLGLAGPIRTGTRAAKSGTHLTFDQLVVQARRVLNDTDVAALLPDAYPLVIVDEFQDTSPALLDLLRAGFVGKSQVRCFGDSHQRIQPGSFAFDAHGSACGGGAEEHHIEPIPGFCRFKTHDISVLAEAFRDGRRFSGRSGLVKVMTVPTENEQLAHAIHWDALAAVKAGRSYAVICFSNPTVGSVASLLAMPTEKRPHRLPVGVVTSKHVMAAQDGLYVALLRHWATPGAETSRRIVEALALLTVGGNPDHKHYVGRVKRLAKALNDGELPVSSVCGGDADRFTRISDLVESLGSVAGSLGDAVVAIWKSSSWSLGGLRSLAWRLSQTIPDGLDPAAADFEDRLVWAWDQARRWRLSKPDPVLVMTVNQSKNREFDDVVVYVDGFQNEVRGPMTDLNRMQMYVAVSRARRSVKLIHAQSKLTKPSALLNTVVP